MCAFIEYGNICKQMLKHGCFVDFSSVKFWYFAEKSYFCIRFRERNLKQSKRWKR